MYKGVMKIGTIITGDSTKKYISDIEELIELYKVVAKHNKIVNGHIKNEESY